MCLARYPDAVSGGRAVFRVQLADEILDLHRAQVLPGPGAHRDRAIFLFAVADHQLVRNLLQRVLADLIADLLVPQIGSDAEALIRKGFPYLLGPFGLRVSDIHHHGLHRGEPGREGAGVVFDQDADETLHRADDRPVQHHRVAAGRMLVDVFGAEAAGHHEIDLHRAQLPGAADRVLEVVFDLGAVERALARQFVPGDTAGGQRRAQRRLGAVPGGVVAEPVVRTQRDLDRRFAEAEV